MRCRIALFSPDDRLLKKLADIGDVVWVPLIKLKPVEGSSVRAVEALRKCPIAAFVSPRTIEMLIKDAEDLGVKEVLVKLLRNSFIAVIGKETGESVLKHLGVKPHMVSPRPYTAHLLSYLRSKGIACATLFKAEASYADTVKAEGLSINVVKVYRYEVIEENIGLVKKLVEGANLDTIVLTSYTIAKIVCESLGGVRGIPVVAFGETTAKGMAKFCGEEGRTVVGDGTVETLRDILVRICRSSPPHVPRA